ncbi:MAG: hypothetical protein A2583_16025 [Bdellovibrionales bacterium RIFOXYD1_FULL_53_11]|nr:MAG: hypothetical protein A2583_16025 [Bdellovibrionales bacterium RIFOXYD1_FULL_53_11]
MQTEKIMQILGIPQAASCDRQQLRKSIHDIMNNVNSLHLLSDYLQAGYATDLPNRDKLVESYATSVARVDEIITNIISLLEQNNKNQTNQEVHENETCNQ